MLLGLAMAGCDPEVSIDEPTTDLPPGDDPPADDPPGDEPPNDDPPAGDAVNIDAVAPALASASGGTIVRLSASGFNDDFTVTTPSVAFGDVGSTNVTAVDSVTLDAEVPALAAGDVDVEIVASTATATFAGFQIVAALTAGEVIVNESLPNPGGLDASRDGAQSNVDDEYVELVNLRSTAVDLSGFTLSDTAALRHVFVNPTTLPPAGSLVVFGTANLADSAPPFAATHNSGQAQNASTGALSLNNGGDTVTLADPAGAVIDSVDFGAGTAGVSLNRDPDGSLAGIPTAHNAVAGAAPDPTTGGDISPGLQVDQSAW